MKAALTSTLRRYAGPYLAVNGASALVALGAASTKYGWLIVWLSEQGVFYGIILVRELRQEGRLGFV